MDGEVTPSDYEFPSWDNANMDESSYDTQSFNQQVIVESNVKLNQVKKESAFHLTKNKHHVYKQMGSANDGSKVQQNRMKKMWHVILDSQLTCDVIINGERL